MPGHPFLAVLAGVTAGASLLSSATAAGAERPSSPSASPLARCMHAAANVNDPRSHGVLGDGLLSLNEAIQLHNGALTLAQLSAGELGQVAAFAGDISEIVVDATIVPWITVEQDLDIIVDTPHGLEIVGQSGYPVIDFTNSNVHYGFRAHSDLCSWRNLVLLGAPRAIELRQANAVYGGTVIDDVVFDGQTQAGLDIAGTLTGGQGRVLLDRCTFKNAPLAIRCDETIASRSSILGVFHSRLATTQDGIEMQIGDGGNAQCLLEAVRVDAPGTGIRLTRPAGGNRPLWLGGLHLDVAAAMCLSIDGSPVAPTQLELRMLQFAASAGGTALAVGPLGADSAGIVEDSTLAGDVTLLAGGGTAPLRFENCRVAGGQLLLGGQAAQPVQLRQVVAAGSNLTTTGTAAVTLFGCSLEGGTVNGTATAPVQTTYCYSSAAGGAHTSHVSPLPAPPIGSFALVPRDPTIGGTATVQALLPPGLVAIFAIAPTAETPLLLDPPVHLYLDLAQALFVPGAYRLQQSVVIGIPTIPALLGTDWVCQAAVVADAGVAAPPVDLPPGRRFELH